MFRSKRFYAGLLLFSALIITTIIVFNIRRTKERAPTPAAPVTVAEVKENRDAATEAPDDSVASVIDLRAATLENIKLRSELEWAFGGKVQRGWSLYIPLIRHLIGSDADVETNAFATALARWQQSAKLPPTGILDEATWRHMVAHWQAHRLKDRSYPLPDQIQTAPVTDFYDPSRPDALRQVEREAYAAYKRMAHAAARDPSLRLLITKDGELASSENRLKIISAFRSREYQEQLRRQSPNAGPAGLAINSPHFTGRALDIYVGGEPVSTEDHNRMVQTETPVYRWLVRNAAEFGFHPYFYEPWHWEYFVE